MTELFLYLIVYRNTYSMTLELFTEIVLYLIHIVYYMLAGVCVFMLVIKHQIYSTAFFRIFTICVSSVVVGIQIFIIVLFCLINDIEWHFYFWWTAVYWRDSFFNNCFLAICLARARVTTQAGNSYGISSLHKLWYDWVTRSESILTNTLLDASCWFLLFKIEQSNITCPRCLQ